MLRGPGTTREARRDGETNGALCQHGDWLWIAGVTAELRAHSFFFQFFFSPRFQSHESQSIFKVTVSGSLELPVTGICSLVSQIEPAHRYSTPRACTEALTSRCEWTSTSSRKRLKTPRQRVTCIRRTELVCEWGKG